MIALFTHIDDSAQGKLTINFATLCSTPLVLAVLLTCLTEGVSAVSFSDRPALDTWIVTGGTVSIDCPVNSTCTEQVEDSGFLQRKVTDEFGNSFYQHVLTEPGATGDPYSETNNPFSANSLSFHDEHIIRTGLSTLNLGAGDQVMNRTHVVSKTFIAENDIVGDIENRFFQLNGTQYTGNSNGNWPVWGIQEISQIDWGGIDPVELMNTHFSFSGGTGFGMNGLAINVAVDQFINLGDGGLQGFTYQGDPVIPTIHTANPLDPLLPGGTNGGDISWAPSNSVTATWVGQYNPEVTTSPEFSMTAFRTLSGSLVVDETRLVSQTVANPPGPWHPDLLALSSYFSTPVDLFEPRPMISATSWAIPTGLVGTKPHETPAVGTGGNGPPIPLGGWVVVDGEIILNESCPLAASSCSSPIAGNGMLTREITINGNTYIQTVVTEKNASGDPNAEAIFDTTLADFQPNGYLTFADETFVRKGGDKQGLSAKNQLAEVGMVTPINGSPFAPIDHTWDPFTYDTRINVGWAQGGAADPVLTVSQRLDSYNPNNAGVPGKVLQNSFDMAVLSTGAKDYTMISSHGYNTHYSRTIEGGFQNTDHIPDPFNPLLPDLGSDWGTVVGGSDIHQGWDHRTPTNGGDITWSAGDALNVTWVGSDYRASGSHAQQSATSFTNLTTGERTALTNRSAMGFIVGVGRIPVAPDGLPWIDPFATPTLPNTPTNIEHPWPE